jgi:3-dehydroquinate synthetase
MIGAFYQPKAVVCDLAVLATLPENEYLAGLAEIVKYGVIYDEKFFAYMEQNVDQIKRHDFETLKHLIFRSCEIKAEVVGIDEKESGLRAILNYGHTFGHAIESFNHQPGRQPVAHGAAVGIGMVCALQLSVAKLGLPQHVLDRYRVVAAKLTAIPRYTLRDTEELLTYMRRDKKNASGHILCVLLQDIGAPVIDLQVDENEIRNTLLKLC